MLHGRQGKLGQATWNSPPTRPVLSGRGTHVGVWPPRGGAPCRPDGCLLSLRPQPLLPGQPQWPRPVDSLLAQQFLLREENHSRSTAQDSEAAARAHRCPAQVPRSLPLGDGFPPAPRRLNKRQRETESGTESGTERHRDRERQGQRERQRKRRGGHVWLQSRSSGTPLSSRDSHHRPWELRVTAWLDRISVPMPSGCL